MYWGKKASPDKILSILGKKCIVYPNPHPKAMEDKRTNHNLGQI